MQLAFSPPPPSLLPSPSAGARRPPPPASPHRQPAMASSSLGPAVRLDGPSSSSYPAAAESSKDYLAASHSRPSHRQHFAPSSSPPFHNAALSHGRGDSRSTSSPAFAPSSFPPPTDRAFFAPYSPQTTTRPGGGPTSSPFRPQLRPPESSQGRTPIPAGAYDHGLLSGGSGRPGSSISPSMSLPSISQFLNPRLPLLASNRSSPAGVSAYSPPMPRPPANSSVSVSFLPAGVSSSKSPQPRPPVRSPTKRRLAAVDPARLPLPPSPAGPSAYNCPHQQQDGGRLTSDDSSPAKRRRPPPSPSAATLVANGGRLRQKPSLEAVLLPTKGSSKSEDAAPRQARQSSTTQAKTGLETGLIVKVREGSVSSDGSSEFEILAPYISRPSASSTERAPPARSQPQPQRERQQTPLRSSTSLPALLADLDSSSDDDDGQDSTEAFTPRGRPPRLDGAHTSCGSHGSFRTPGSASSSLLDSVLSAPDGSRSAHAGEERRKWALIRRSGVGGHADDFGRSPPTSATQTGGLLVPRSRSYPSLQIGALSPAQAPPAQTPARPYYHPAATAVLTETYALPALDLTRRSPGGILTPYRSTTAAVPAPSGQGGGPTLAAAAGQGRPRGHRREPSRAETECYWQSSPSDSTAAAAAPVAEVSSADPSDVDGASEDELSESSDTESESKDSVEETEDAARRAFGPGSTSSDPVTLPASPPAPPAPLPRPPPLPTLPSLSASLGRSSTGNESCGPALTGSSFVPQQQHRLQPIEPLLFHPYSATPTALPSVVSRTPVGPTSSLSSSSSSLGRLVSAAATVERHSAAIGAETGEDGRSTSSDKENHGRRLEVDVFGGKAPTMTHGLPSVVVAPPPSSADSFATGGDRSRRKKKALGGTASRTSPVIQECDLPPVNLPAGPRSAAKPAYSYAAMIGQAILAHPRKRLSLAEIYNWISGAYPFFKKGEAGWMNSIRHNLSLNKCFIKVERDKTRDGAAVVVGKGMLWAIEDGCEHQFEGGGFNKKATGPPAKGKASGDRSSKSATPATEVVGSKKRKVGAGGTALSDESESEPSPPLPSSQLHPAKRLKLSVAINPSAQLFAEQCAPSPAGSSQGYDSPEVGSQSLPSLASAFVPRDGSSYPTLPMPRGMLYGARPPVSAANYELHAPDVGHGGGPDDYATPQRPLSRGPPGQSGGPTSVPSSSQEMPPPASCLRGLPHLTPSLSSPASSSPAQPFVPRPRAVQAHQALLRSSLGQSESVSIVDDAQAYDDGLASSAAVPVGLQPGFQIAKASTSPKPSSLVPASPTTSRFHSAVAPGIQSPMSSLRATANDDEVVEHAPIGVAPPAHAWRPPTGNPGYYNFTGAGHLSPLNNRKLSANGGSSIHGDRAGRGLSATGELVNHAMRDPPPSAGVSFRTPGMQPISASPRDTLPRPWAYPGGPASPGSVGLGGMPLSSSSRRGMLLHVSSTPKGGSTLSYGLTPARTPLSHPTQSPAGAALLQRRAELGMLGAELTYGDDDVASTPGGVRRPVAHTLSGDPYDSGSAVEHELRHIGSASKVFESPGGPGGWGGGGRTIATPVRPTGWIHEPDPSPGFGLGSPGRPAYVFR